MFFYIKNSNKKYLLLRQNVALSIPEVFFSYATITELFSLASSSSSAVVVASSCSNLISARGIERGKRGRPLINGGEGIPSCCPLFFRASDPPPPPPSLPPLFSQRHSIANQLTRKKTLVLRMNIARYRMPPPSFAAGNIYRGVFFVLSPSPPPLLCPERNARLSLLIQAR